MNISVILPSYNAEAHLKGTLQALTQQDYAGSYEIIVVDCSHGDAVKNICAKYDKTIFHHEEKRFSPGIGRNIGATLARGELLIFVDTDVVLSRDALRAAWRYYDQGHDIFGGALELNVDENPSIASYVEHYFFNSEAQKLRRECVRRNLSSALLMFDRTTFLEHGGFKNIPRIQDTELTERLLKLGLSLYFTPSVVGFQIQDSPIGKVLRKVYVTGRNLFFVRYQEWPTERQVFLFFMLPAITVAKVLRIIGRHLLYQNLGNRVRALALTPAFFICGVCWMIGIYRSMLLGGGISLTRE